MSSIDYTFIQRPDTQLATVIKGALAHQRSDDTRVVEQSVLASAAPTAFFDLQTPVAQPAGSSPSVMGPAPVAQQRRYASDDFATVIANEGPTQTGASGFPQPAMIRKSLPQGFMVHKYRIEGIIGEGGFGITYRGRDLTIDREVAIKELFMQGTCFRAHSNEVMIRPQSNDERVMRWAKFFFSEEARITFALRHEGIVRIYDFFKTNNAAYIVYEMLQGSDLQAWGKASRHELKHGQVLDLFRATCDALGHVHKRGFVHRDLKPANIFITAEVNKPILIDFGAATALGTPPSGEIIVTPGYSPPEQYDPKTPQDARTDIYSLCATLYWALSGQVPLESRLRTQADELKPL